MALFGLRRMYSTMCRVVKINFRKTILMGGISTQRHRDASGKKTRRLTCVLAAFCLASSTGAAPDRSGQLWARDSEDMVPYASPSPSRIWRVRPHLASASPLQFSSRKRHSHHIALFRKIVRLPGATLASFPSIHLILCLIVQFAGQRDWCVLFSVWLKFRSSPSNIYDGITFFWCIFRNFF